MKYWNKDKEVRRRCWTKISKPNNVSNQELKRWCQNQTSNGKFYYYYGTDTWWFQDHADAMMFILRWA